jgi:translation initiation factor IF-3
MLRQSLLHGRMATTRTLRSLPIPAMLMPSIVNTKKYDIASCNFSNRERSSKTNLTNEHLVRALMKRFNGITAEDITVRLVVSNDDNATSNLVNLLEAVKTAADLELDLIGISLNQNPPIVKVADLDKLRFSHKKNSSRPSKSAPKKIQFSAAIAENDFSRKIKEAVGYLEKGHDCLLKLQSSNFSRRLDGECVPQLLSQIKEALAGHGNFGDIKMDPEKKTATATITPK